MELRQLRYFVAVAEELHFGRAAARLHVAQPAVSQQIKALERELGVERDSRHVQLTPPGRALLERARRLLADASEAAKVTHAVDADKTGRVRLCYSIGADIGASADLVRRFHARHPDVDLQLRIGFDSDNQRALRHGEVDAAFVWLPSPADEGVRMLRIASVPFVAVLPTGHPLATLERVPITDFAVEPIVLFEQELSPGAFERIVTGIHSSRGINPRIVDRQPTQEAMAAAVASGGAVTVMAQARARAQLTDGVVSRPFEPPVPYVDIGIAWLAENCNPALAQFIDMAHDA